MKCSIRVILRSVPYDDLPNPLTPSRDNVSHLGIRNYLNINTSSSSLCLKHSSHVLSPCWFNPKHNSMLALLPFKKTRTASHSWYWKCKKKKRGMLYQMPIFQQLIFILSRTSRLRLHCRACGRICKTEWRLAQLPMQSEYQAGKGQPQRADQSQHTSRVLASYCISLLLLESDVVFPALVTE